MRAMLNPPLKAYPLRRLKWLRAIASNAPFTNDARCALIVPRSRRASAVRAHAASQSRIAFASFRNRYRNFKRSSCRRRDQISKPARHCCRNEDREGAERAMWSRFVADQRGGVAPMFALAIVPIIGLVGAAVDYSRGNAARTAMLASLDATALMLSRDAADHGRRRRSPPRRHRYFNAQFNRPEVAERPGQRGADQPAAGQLHARCDGERQRADDVHASVLGQTKIDIGSSAQVKWGVKKLELALVLDNTGSMASNGKMTELKTAVAQPARPRCRTPPSSRATSRSRSSRSTRS